MAGFVFITFATVIFPAAAIKPQPGQFLSKDELALPQSFLQTRQATAHTLRQLTESVLGVSGRNSMTSDFFEDAVLPVSASISSQPDAAVKPPAATDGARTKKDPINDVRAPFDVGNGAVPLPSNYESPRPWRSVSVGGGGATHISLAALKSASIEQPSSQTQKAHDAITDFTRKALDSAAEDAAQLKDQREAYRRHIEGKAHQQQMHTQVSSKTQTPTAISSKPEKLVPPHPQDFEEDAKQIFEAQIAGSTTLPPARAPPVPGASAGLHGGLAVHTSLLRRLSSNTSSKASHATTSALPAWLAPARRFLEAERRRTGATP